MEADRSDLPPVHFTHQAHMDRMIYGTSVSDQQGRRVHPLDVFATGRRFGRSLVAELGRQDARRQARCDLAVREMLARRGLWGLGMGLRTYAPQLLGGAS